MRWLSVLAVAITASSVAWDAPELWQVPDPEQELYSSFGFSVTVGGGRLFVGAPQSSLPLVNVGRVEVFDAESGRWLMRIQPDGLVSLAQFGRTVVTNGELLLVGTPGSGGGSGRVYIFDAATGAPQGTLAALEALPGDRFGGSVAIDGPRAVVGAIGDDELGNGVGAAYVFDARSFEQVARLLPEDPVPQARFGNSVLLHGTIAIVGAPGTFAENYAGAVYLFDLESGTRVKLAPETLEAGDRFGESMAIDGGVLLVGAPEAVGTQGPCCRSGAVYMFDLLTLEAITRMTPVDGLDGDEFGTAMSAHSGRVLIGAPFHTLEHGLYGGAAYLFDVDTGVQLSKLVPTGVAPMARVGLSTALLVDRALVGGGPGAGAFGSAWMFDVRSPCPADFNGDRVVGLSDLLVLLDSWGPCDACAADLYADDAVGHVDLVILLSEWGPC